MPIKLNTAAFKTVVSHSDALSVLCSIAHPCQKTGSFQGRVLQGRRVVAKFLLNVDDNATSTQANIDLASLVEGGQVSTRSKKMKAFSLKTGGYALFYVSAGKGRYVVELRKSNAASSKPVFSSRVLNKGDIFSAQLIRPGRYNVTNTKNDKKAVYDVVVPDGGQKAMLAATPLMVTCSDKGFDPREGEVTASVGVAFVIETPSAVHIDMYKNEKGKLISSLATQKIRTPRYVRPMRAGGLS